jgi:hypothetical protein
MITRAVKATAELQTLQFLNTLKIYVVYSLAIVCVSRVAFVSPFRYSWHQIKVNVANPKVPVIPIIQASKKAQWNRHKIGSNKCPAACVANGTMPTGKLMIQPSGANKAR